MSNPLSVSLFAELTGLPDGNLRHYKIIRLPEKELAGRISIRTVDGPQYHWHAPGSLLPKGTLSALDTISIQPDSIPVLAWRKAQGEEVRKIRIEQSQTEDGQRFTIPEWDAYLDHLQATNRGQTFRPEPKPLHVKNDISADMKRTPRDLALLTFNLNDGEVIWSSR